jgi:hypothetical protein
VIIDEEVGTMRNLTMICCVVAVSVVAACAPSEPPPPAAEPTPAVASDETIGSMDFESGEADNAGTDTAEEGAQETPVPE